MSYVIATDNEMTNFLQNQDIYLQIDEHNGKKNLVCYFKPFPVKYYNYVKKWYPTKDGAKDKRTPKKNTIMLQLFRGRVNGRETRYFLPNQYVPFAYDYLPRKKYYLRTDPYAAHHPEYKYWQDIDPNSEPKATLLAKYQNCRSKPQPFHKIKHLKKGGLPYDKNPQFIWGPPSSEKYKWYLTPTDARKGYKILFYNITSGGDTCMIIQSGLTTIEWTKRLTIGIFKYNKNEGIVYNKEEKNLASWSTAEIHSI